jgi:hypothetical protein
MLSGELFIVSTCHNRSKPLRKGSKKNQGKLTQKTGEVIDWGNNE